MAFINGLSVLLIYQFVGELAVRTAGIPVPGSVLGMVLLFMTLVVRGRVSKSTEQASTHLLSHLSLLFVPAGVGIMTHLSKIADEWLPITLALLLSTVITLMATARMMQLSHWFLAKRRLV